MYKSRFKTWELRKTRAGLEAGPKRRAAGRRTGTSGKDVVGVTHSGLVGPIKVQRSSKRAELPGRKSATASGAGDQIYLAGTSPYIWRSNNSSPRRTPSPSSSSVTAPDSLRLPEGCVRAILDFTTSRFDTETWKFSDEEAECEDSLCEWSNKTLVATETIQRGNTKAGFRMLQICLQQYRSLVLSGHPLLFHKSLGAMFYLSQVGPDLAACFVRYAASLCSIYLGDRHPLTRLFVVLRSLDLPKIRQYARVLLQAECDIFLDRFGTENKYVAVIRVLNSRVFQKFGVIPLSVATTLISSIRDKMAEDIPHWTLNYVIWAQLELVYTYVNNKDFIEADAALQYVGNCLEAQPDELDFWSKTHYYMLRAQVMENLGLRDVAAEMYKARLNVCLGYFGRENRHTARALGDLERHYRNGGEVETAERLRLDFEANWDRVCAREGSPTADGTPEVPLDE